MNANELNKWTNDVNQLKNEISRLINPYDSIVNRYEAAYNAAVGDDAKENVINIFNELTNAKNQLCALMGGRRSRRSKVAKRTRKHRR